MRASGRSARATLASWTRLKKTTTTSATNLTWRLRNPHSSLHPRWAPLRWRIIRLRTRDLTTYTLFLILAKYIHPHTFKSRTSKIWALAINVSSINFVRHHRVFILDNVCKNSKWRKLLVLFARSTTIVLSSIDRRPLKRPSKPSNQVSKFENWHTHSFSNPNKLLYIFT